MGDLGTLYAVVEAGDERSRQYRHSLDTGLATPVTWCGIDGGERVDWVVAQEVRERSDGTEEWVLEVRASR